MLDRDMATGSVLKALMNFVGGHGSSPFVFVNDDKMEKFRYLPKLDRDWIGIGTAIDRLVEREDFAVSGPEDEVTNAPSQFSKRAVLRFNLHSPPLSSVRL